MKLFFKITVSIIFIWGFQNKSILVAQNIKFNLFKNTNGIIVGKIVGMTQDKYGFMWFLDQQNSRLLKYDGTRLVAYQNNPKNTNSLSSGKPESVYADKEGNIWVGFLGKGLDKFNPNTNIFTHYRNDPKNPESLVDDVVVVIFEDHLGNLWFGTGKGLDLFEKKTGKFKHFQRKVSDQTSLSCDTVRGIYEDREGTLWVGTGFFNDKNNEGGLNRFNRETGTFTRYLNNPKNPKSLINNKVRAICEDSKGNFWIGTSGDGLHKMNRKTGEFERFTYDAKNPNKLSRPPVIDKDYKDNINFITEDTEGDLWIGTESNGINVYNPTTKKLTHFGNDANKSGNFKDNSAWWSCLASDGHLWISTEETNLFSVEPPKIQIPRFTLEDSCSAHSFFEDSDSIRWIGTDKGLIRQDLKTGKSTRYKHQKNNPSSLVNDTILQIEKDKLGFLWLGTIKGISRFDIKKNIFTSLFINANDSMSFDNLIYEIYSDKNKNLWVGSIGGLRMIEVDSPKLTALPYYTNRQIIGLVENNKGEIIVGRGHQGESNKINLKTHEVRPISNDIQTFVFRKDNNGSIWAISVITGLNYYDENSGDFHPIQEKYSDLTTAGLHTFITDLNNNIWLGSDQEIYKLNNKRDNLILFNESNGVNPHSMQGIYKSAFRANDGKLYFGCQNGYYAFYPDKLFSPKDTIPINLNNFWINGELVSQQGFFKTNFYTSPEIKLKYNQNTFTLDFSIVDFGNSNEKHSYCILENYEKEWKPYTSNEKVFYSNLPPGNYTFKIKTANSNSGVLSEKNINILIFPPWWRTWWAYILFALAFVGSVWAFIQYRSRKLIAENKNLEIKVKERTEELVKQKTELVQTLARLTATQNQLIQSEKLASLGELTAGIAHEIQNPLNFVNNFSKMSIELANEVRDEIKKIEMAKNDKDYIGEIISDLNSNQTKIAFHGERASSIVKGMLEHSRHDTGKREMTDINKLCDQYFRLADSGLRSKFKDLVCKMESHFDITIPEMEVVPQDMGRVILNIINNAFYAVNERKNAVETLHATSIQYEPKVTISTQKIGDKIEIRIKDNGTGMPEKVKEKIFQPFFTTKPTGSGTGLGLSLAYDIITKGHGGTLIVESMEGVGTEMIITI